MSRRAKLIHLCLLASCFAGLLAPALRAQSQTTVNVASNVQANVTPILLKAGQKVIITATGTANISDANGGYTTDPSGTIVVAPAQGTGAYTFFTNDAAPEGTPPAVGNKKTIIDEGQLNGAPFGALVAAVSPFTLCCNALSQFTLIGTGPTTYVAPNNGFLYLAVNDINNSSDDSGGYTAVVQTLDATIAAVEFTQAIQEYQTLDELNASLQEDGEPPVPIIAGKYGAMRVYLGALTQATDVVVTASGAITPTESKTVSIQPNCLPEDQRAGINGCQSVDFVFTAPADTWTATVTLSDTSGNQLQQQTFTITSRTTKHVFLVSVKACAENIRFPAKDLKICGDPMNLVPLSEKFESMSPVERVEYFPSKAEVSVYLDGTSFPTSILHYLAWDDAILEHTKPYFTARTQSLDVANNTYTDFASLFDPAVGNTASVADINGHAFMTAQGVKETADEPSQGLLAHEAGHTLSLLHTNRLAPGAPSCGLAPQPGSYWPFPDNYIQSEAGVYEDGFDGHNPLPSGPDIPNSSFEVMSYCGNRWISPISYDREIEKLGGGAVLEADGRTRIGVGAAAALARTPLPAGAPVTVVTGSYWQIGGNIDPVNGLAFDPVFQQTVDGTSDPGTGTYSIEVLDASNNVLYTRFFTPDVFQVDGSDDNNYPSNPTFSEWIPVTAGAASVAVLDNTSTVIGSLPVTGPSPAAKIRPAGAIGGSGDGPVVTITSPVAGFVGNGEQTISWTAQEGNITAFTARILYSPDGGTTWYQHGDIGPNSDVPDTSSSSDTVDFSDLPGSTNALIQVLVSDGVNTGSATSAPFTVPKHPPSGIVITSPPDGSARPAADLIALRGGALDAEDGFLQGSALSWSSDIQGSLGTGSPLFVYLNPGVHNITLTGTDSDGNSISTSVKVTIGGGRPIVSLSTSTLSANCISATLNATIGAQGAPLSQVQYSLDGGVTYTSVALNQLPFSFVVPGSGNVNVVLRAYDISNQSAAQSTAISIPSACSAGTPFISGGSAQASVVGASFANPLAVLVSDMNGNPVSGATVNFTAPASGASATLSSGSATSNASGIATVTATANSTNGIYNVVASVPGFSTTAQFALTNTDFAVSLDNASPTIQRGDSAVVNITVNPLSGFSAAVALACTGLPTGVTCQFSSPSVTPSGAQAASKLTIAVAKDTKDPVKSNVVAGMLAAVAFALCFAAPRRKYVRLVALFVALAALGTLSACSSQSSKPFTATISVTATSGSLQHSTPLTLSIK